MCTTGTVETWCHFYILMPFYWRLVWRARQSPTSRTWTQVEVWVTTLRTEHLSWWGDPTIPEGWKVFLSKFKLFHVLWIRYWHAAQEIPMIPGLGCNPKSLDPRITFSTVLRRFVCVNWVFRVHRAYPGILTITAPTHLFFSLPF